jgi:hypothetical protein
MSFGSDGGPESFDFTGFSEEERAADDAHEFAAHILLLLPDAEGCNCFVIWIAEQRKIQLLFGFERSLSSDGIGAHAEDGDIKFIEMLFCVTKLGRFDGSTGCVGFGIEKEQDAAALEIFQGDFLAFVGQEAEGGGFGAYFEHWNSSLQVLACHQEGRSVAAPLQRAAEKSSAELISDPQEGARRCR